MNFQPPVRSTLLLAITAAAVLILPAAHAEIPQPLPDPDDKAAEMTKPVKVAEFLTGKI